MSPFDSPRPGPRRFGSLASPDLSAGFLGALAPDRARSTEPHACDGSPPRNENGVLARLEGLEGRCTELEQKLGASDKADNIFDQIKRDLQAHAADLAARVQEEMQQQHGSFKGEMKDVMQKHVSEFGRFREEMQQHKQNHYGFVQKHESFVQKYEVEMHQHRQNHFGVVQKHEAMVQRFEAEMRQHQHNHHGLVQKHEAFVQKYESFVQKYDVEINRIRTDHSGLKVEFTNLPQQHTLELDRFRMQWQSQHSSFKSHFEGTLSNYAAKLEQHPADLARIKEEMLHQHGLFKREMKDVVQKHVEEFVRYREEMQQHQQNHYSLVQKHETFVQKYEVEMHQHRQNHSGLVQKFEAEMRQHQQNHHGLVQKHEAFVQKYESFVQKYDVEINRIRTDHSGLNVEFTNLTQQHTLELDRFRMHWESQHSSFKSHVEGTLGNYAAKLEHHPADLARIKEEMRKHWQHVQQQWTTEYSGHFAGYKTEIIAHIDTQISMKMQGYAAWSELGRVKDSVEKLEQILLGPATDSP